MQVDRNAYRRLQRLDEVVGIVGGDQAGHVLDADRVGAHIDKLFGLADVVVEVIYLAAEARLGQGVAHTALEVLAALLDLAHHRFKIAVVVQRVESTEDIDSVLRRTIDEGSRHVVGIVAVTNEVLCAQQHRERGFLGVTLEGAQTLPRIFVEEAVHRVEGRAAPGFKGPEANFVEHFGDRDHILGTATGSENRLVSVAQRQIHDLHRIDGLGPIAGVIERRLGLRFTHFSTPQRH